MHKMIGRTGQLRRPAMAIPWGRLLEFGPVTGHQSPASGGPGVEQDHRAGRSEKFRLHPGGI